MKKVIASLSALLLFLSVMPPLTSLAEDYQPSHYIEKNKSRYEAFEAKNPKIPYNEMLAYVNANVDKGFYNGVVTVRNPSSTTILVNKNFVLPTGYEPGDLVTFLGGHRLRREAARQLVKMRDDMLSLGYRMTVIATYRSFGTQTNSYNNAVARFGVANAEVSFARPGHSEHQTGLAVDLLHVGGFDYMQNSGFEKTKEFTWLQENAYRYGFILRYPDGYRDIHGFIFEPWHWRYVGVAAATAMHIRGIALLEEYYGQYLAPGVLTKKFLRADSPPQLGRYTVQIA